MKTFFKVFFGLCLCFSLFVFASCGSLEEDASASISETRDDFYYAKNGDYFVTFTSGKREQNYLMDGISTSLTPYGVVVLKTQKDIGKTPSFSIKSASKTYSSKMEINPYDMSFVADICEEIKGEDEITFSLPEQNFEISLKNLSKNWRTTQSKALDIFVKHKQNELKKYQKTGLDGEIYIKIVGDNEENIYYYVLFVGRDGNTISSLIDVNSGEIVQS